jgi:hypothetical protein
MVDPHNTIEKTSWKNVRYQLLTALCGTIIQAKNDNSTIAVLVIHEFLSNVTSVAKLADNHKELERFLTVASDHRGRDDADFRACKLYGPFSYGDIDCLIGKVVTSLTGEKNVVGG